MSRSFKHHPGGGVASSRGQKLYRSQENKAHRRQVRKRIQQLNFDMPHPKEYGNEWSSPRDGKCYWVNHDKKWMRK